MAVRAGGHTLGDRRHRGAGLPAGPAAPGALAVGRRADGAGSRAGGRAAPRRQARQLRQALRQPALWLCTAAYFCIVGGNATLAFWMPSLVRELGVRGALDIGLLSAIPFTLGTVAMVLNGAHSDKTGERRRIAPAPRWSARRARADRRLHRQPGAGHGRAERIRIGVLGAFPVFWAIPAGFLTGTAPPAASPSSTRSATWRASPRPS